MIQAVIKIDKDKTTDAFITLKAYLPFSITKFISREEFENAQGAVDMKEIARQNIEYKLTKTIMKDFINDIRELQNIIPYCKDNDEAVKDAFNLCQKLEQNLRIKAIYEDEVSSDSHILKEFMSKFNENEIKKFLDENKES